MINYMGESVHIALLGRLPSSLLLPLVITLIVCAVVSLGLVFNRLRLHKGRLLVVVGLNLVAWLLLVALLSPVQRRDDEPPEVVLVTYSAIPLSEAMFSDIPPDATVWFTQKAWLSLSRTPWFKEITIHRPKIVREPEDIIWAEPSLQHLVVLGDGMTRQQWQRFSQRGQRESSSVKVTLKDTQTVTGPVALRWQRRLSRGQWQQVSGVLQVAPDEAKGNLQQTLYQVYLKDPAGQVVAQQAVRDGEAFNLLVKVKTEGLWQYRLQLVNALSEQPVAEENIAFEVTRPTLAKLLIRQSAPSFETRHVKNWAAEQGAQVTVETQISKTRYISEHVNYSPAASTEDKPAEVDSFDTLSALNHYDLVIIDSRGLMSLSQSQQANLASAVRGGLGVLVIGDSTLFTENNLPGVLNPFQISRGVVGENDKSLLSWQFDQAGEPLHVLAAEISASSGFTLVTGAAGRGIVTGTHYGSGKVAISLTNQSNQWRTAGQAMLHSRYWHFLVEKLSRPSSAVYIQPVEEHELALTRQPLSQCFSANENLSDNLASYSFTYQSREGNSLALLPQVDHVNQNLACSVIYPASGGWQHLRLSATNETVSQALYIYDDNDWPAWQQQRKQSAGKQFQGDNQVTFPRAYWSELALWPWWWGILLTCSLLWIERKFWVNRVESGGA